MIAKIRLICTSPNAHQWPLNQGCFHHLVYPIRAPERLLECEYEGRFFECYLKNGGLTWEIPTDCILKIYSAVIKLYSFSGSYFANAFFTEEFLLIIISNKYGQYSVALWLPCICARTNGDVFRIRSRFKSSKNMGDFK